MIKFYDTSSLLIAGEDLFNGQEKFAFSSITLQELEDIKTSNYKDQETKIMARFLLNELNKNPKLFICIPHEEQYEISVAYRFSINNDMRILSDAIFFKSSYDDDVIFVTNDLSLKQIANLYFIEHSVESIEIPIDNYTGYLEEQVDDETLEQFYLSQTSDSLQDKNLFNLYINQYLVLRDSGGKMIDLRKWDGEEFRYLKDKPLKSKWFGEIKPIDIYQRMALDSFRTNQLTVLKGKSGSGKSLLSMACLISKLENHSIDKIIVLCNPVATINSAKLGFYPGDKDTKLLDSQIGNFLGSKLGDRSGVEQLMSSGKLLLLPFSDIRGYDTTGMNAGIYITEAQNLDATLMKLALQRIGEDCFCIIDGDNKSQVDMEIYQKKNGMTAMSKIFRGQDMYGEIELAQIHRSKIASIADRIGG